MANAKLIRIQLGISQAVFADLIDCTIGQLTMAESGLRNLPLKSVEILDQLDVAFSQSLSTPSNTAMDESIVAMLDKYIRNQKNVINRLKENMQRVDEKLEQSQRPLHLSKSFDTAPFLPAVGVVHLTMQILHRHSKKVTTLKCNNKNL